jgi:type I restriction enzyme S subunit
MRDGWRLVQLGEVAYLDVEKVPVVSGTTYQIAGVLNAGRGMLRRDPIDGADTNYPALHRLRAGQLVMRKLTAWEGPITIVPEEYDGYVVSTEFPTFSLDPDALSPAFMNLLCQQPQFWERMRSASTGSVQRRKRVNPAQLLAIDVLLPPLAEQLRIVDLVSSVDRARSTADAMRQAAEDAQSALCNEVTASSDEVPMVRLRDVTLKIGSGATPRGGEASYQQSGTPLIRSQNVHDYRFKSQGLAFINDEQATRLDGAAVEEGDVLINITGASVNRVCAAPSWVLPARVNQHVAILRPDRQHLDTSYLVHLLRRSDIKSELNRKSGSGTTRQALTKNQLEEQLMPVPSISVQRLAAALLDSCAAEVDALHRWLTALDAARSHLVADLLAGSHQISSSYDALLEQAS